MKQGKLSVHQRVRVSRSFDREETKELLTQLAEGVWCQSKLYKEVHDIRVTSVLVC